MRTSCICYVLDLCTERALGPHLHKTWSHAHTLDRHLGFSTSYRHNYRKPICRFVNMTSATSWRHPTIHHPSRRTE
ncbi:hypothetical protein N658DRAFT_291553 [Parathielavia hyrcaniae]|uniref:Uncharacterized protein n=1 Tax=Parathielavia hyrcaniae TaxID=113614 RepID=A0AAN6PSY2_9PEZI|nr:hypothetical protein N658DRAFT_291553 [Parathielavia hyrcaniae]